ncbi:MAG TPA: hypothetical protein VJR70_12340, partial [Stellaceae bacterium]|nr:hypothetical protein [Stellaceae bacterium]
MEALFSNYEEVRKSGLFDDEYYLARYPDVAARNLDPLVHFLEEGGREGRDPHPEFDSAFYFEQCQGRGERPDNPLLHYLRIGAARGFKTRRETGERGLLPAGDEPAWPATLVAIEALATVGNSDGSSRLTVAGWALAAEPIVEVALSFGELALASALYGLARPDIAELYPDRPDAGTSGFIIGCELPRLVSGTIEPLLIVRTQGGEIGRQALRVAIPPTATPPDGAGLAPLVVGIDRALVEPHGVLRVEGWVVSPVQVETIEVSIDDAVLGPAELGWVRPDIEERHPDYPNARFSGFRFVG